MDITIPTTPTSNNNNTNTPTPKSPEAHTETPTRIHDTKPLSFTNGVLKRHPPHHHHHFSASPIAITYKECLKNHAATIGGHALDGCGEFMPSPTATHANPTSLKCAACGCHRNFHRREPEDSPPHIATTTTIEYQSHHRHHPPPPPQAQPQQNGSPNSASPPPISSSYYPSAPHMLLALSGGVSGLNENANVNVPPLASPRKRFRTKFSQSQKEKMYQFAERVGWKMQKRDEELVQGFCNEVGVDKGVLKVWMHNNKNSLGKKEHLNGNHNDILRSNNLEISNHSNNETNNNNNSSEGLNHHHNHHHFENESHVAPVIGTNGSSSSS
ncbi:hypothetical protein OIU85_007585 [Salix viminalis]|uniref:ZF-HD dimerization-type domain-containing protein n=1 Tax=Salix viminalis TaxID=40686 RepID=A0A9Q0P9G1_SALVM|nr:hypothetical protein OIU85_007585 [Salix viminalis]